MAQEKTAQAKQRALTRDEQIAADYQTWKGSIYDLAKKHGVQANDVYKAIGQPEMVKRQYNEVGDLVEIPREY